MDGSSSWRGRMSRGMLPLLALQVASEFHRTGRRPPVTAGLLAANTLIYLRPGALNRILPSVEAVCFNPHLILKYGDLKRFFLSPFYHTNETHLVYNMMSLVWKGIQLEASMGSVEFASMIAALLGLSQGITLLLAKSLLLFDYDTAYYYQYSVGFSGILFALKVVLNSQSDDYTYLHGLVLPARHAAWAELILIQLFVPGTSFLGHLGGILAGLVYLKLRSSFSGPDPLTALVQSVVGILKWPFRAAQDTVRSLFSFQRHRISGRGRVGGSESENGVSGMWRCPACTYDNSTWLEVCELCSTERRGHGFSSGLHSSRRSDVPDIEEVRRRRLARFNR